MKKILASVFAVAVMTGCASHYDYYEGGVRYTQDGEDCIYYSGEYANHFAGDIRTMNGAKKIVYRNTRCADLYARDNAAAAPRHDRQVLAPAARDVTPTCVARYAAPVCDACGMRRKYYFVADK